MPMMIAKLRKHCESYCARHVESSVNALARHRSTKGVGKSQPIEWQDAGVTLEYPDLAGVHMPKGGVHDVETTGGYLQYNEV